MPKRFLLAATLCLACTAPASAASLEQVSPYLSGQYFTWEEHGEGRRLLKEQGYLVAAGVVVGGVTDASLTLKGKAETFGGVVQYDGETQSPDPVPIGTDVTYFGAKGDFDVGYRLGSPTLSFEPFAGVGARWWLRGLQDTRTSSGEPISGYTEWWQSSYGRLGMRGRYRGSTGFGAFAEGGAKYPFYTGNTVDFAGFGEATFRPSGRWSAFAETGLQLQHLDLTLYYEGFRWAQSPLKLVGTRLFFQPDSSSDIFGVRVGWTFQ